MLDVSQSTLLPCLCIVYLKYIHSIFIVSAPEQLSPVIVSGSDKDIFLGASQDYLLDLIVYIC